MRNITKYNRIQAIAYPLRPALHPTMRDIVFAAGLYEGEGSVTNTPNISVRMVQKDREMLDWLRERFGGSVNSTISGVKMIQYFYWGLYGIQARGFLYTIYLFLLLRRKQQIRNAFNLENKYRENMR